ncbi:MAG TPA: hypothetical protein VKZ49_01050 [Polyangiaceae bacterium]|nr:hypothetical protein [Polyangiaceae bacterium]
MAKKQREQESPRVDVDVIPAADDPPQITARPKGTPAPGGPWVREDLTMAPEDLGRRGLEEATQDPHPAEDEEEVLPPAESPEAGPGERAMRDFVPDTETADDQLITRMPNRSEHEEKVSRQARQEQGKLRRPDTAGRS